MIFKNQNDLLFDDMAILENTFGKGSLNASSVNANCDCSGYSSTDEDFDTDQISHSAEKVC